MAEELRYSAGSIMLQVIPSLRDAQRIIGKDAKQYGDALEKNIKEGMERGAKKGAQAAGDELTKTATTHAKKAGEKAGQSFTDAYQRITKKGLDQAVAQIGKTTNATLLGFQNRLRQLSRDTTRVGVDIDANAFHAQLRKLEKELDQFSTLSPDIKIAVASGAAKAELEAIEKQASKLDRQSVNINIDIDNAVKAEAELKKLERQAAKTGSQTDDTSNAFRTFNGVLLTAVGLGPALIPVLAGIAGGMALLGPAAIAGVAGLGIGIIGMQGIGDAVSALGDQQKKAATDAEDSAKRIRRAGEAVADAKRNLDRARSNSADSAEESEERVRRAEESAAESAEQSAERVRRAKEAAAQANERALKRQVDAEKRLANAQKEAQKAQEDLAEARRNAQKELDDVADRQRQNELDRRQAVIDLFNATVENNATQEDPGATTLDKEQASINLGNAKLRLEELREEQTDIADEKKKADKDGVNGTDTVKSAQERLTDALEAQKEAQEDVKEAAKEARQTQIDGARDIADAIKDQQRAARDGAREVADAIKAQGDAAESSAQAIDDAQRALNRSQEDYNDALEQTSASQEKVNEALANLTPAAREFALFIHSLRDDFKEIQGIIAAGLFPGLTEAIKILMTGDGERFKTFISEMAVAIGDFAVKFARSFSGKGWQAFFKTLEEFGPKFLDTYGDTFILWMDTTAQLMALLAPWALKFALGVEGVSKKINEFMSSPAAKKFIDEFFGWLAENSGTIMDFFREAARLVVALAVALAPVGLGILQGLTWFFRQLADMDPGTLRTVVIGVLALIAGIQAIAFVAGPLMAIVEVLAIIGAPAALAVAAIFAIVLVLVLLYTKSETARDIINGVFSFIGWVISRIWEYTIKPAIAAFIYLLQDLGSKVNWLWEKVISPVFGWIGRTAKAMGGDIAYAWTYIIWPVLDVFGKIIWQLWNLTVKRVFEAIGGLFSDMGKGFKTVYDTLIKPLFDKFGFDMGDEKGGLLGKIKSAVAGIGKAFGALRELAKAPIGFIVDTVINKGLIGGFNELAKHLPGLDPVTPIPWPPPGWSDAAQANTDPYKNAGRTPGFHTGGVTGVMPGYTPGRDVMDISVSGGEAVMRPEWTVAMRSLDPSYIERANHIARTGGVQAVRQFMGGFANGGEVGGKSLYGNDYSKMMFRGKTLNVRTVKMLLAAEKLAGDTFRITQGSYSTSVAASGSTHAGGGVFDLSGVDANGRNEWALRKAGFAGWIRTPSQGPWPRHVHAVAMGDPTASPSALRQVQSYLRGGDGLGGKDTGIPVTADPSLLESLGGFLGGVLGDVVGWAKDAASNPAEWLKNKIKAPLEQLSDKFGGGTLVKIGKALPELMIEGLVNKVKGIVGLGDAGGSADAGGLKGMAQAMLAERGWGSYWDDFNYIVNKESSWNPKADNPNSTAYGLGQLLAGTAKKTDDPREQLNLMMNYIGGRYGNPQEAREFHENHGWYSDGGVVPEGVQTGLYDDGGILPPGLSAALNLTGSGEHKAVFTKEQWKALKDIANRGSAGGQTVINVPMQPTNATPYDVADAIAFEQRSSRKGGRYNRRDGR